MIVANGKIKKIAICPNCFSKISWDDPKEEILNIGEKSVLCPVCGTKVEIDRPNQIAIEETDVIENSDAVVNGKATTAADAIQNLKDGEKVILTKDIEMSDYISLGNGEVDLNGHQLNLPENCDIEVAGVETIISNGTIDYAANDGYNAAIDLFDGGKLTLNNVVLKSSKQGIGVETNSALALNNSTIIGGADAAICMNGKNAEVNIIGGEISATGQAAIFLNGSKDYGEGKLTIDGAAISSTGAADGDLDVGIAAMNSDTITIKNSTINATKGVGIVVRGGKISVDAATKFNVGGDGEGLVGSSKVAIPAGKEIVKDTKSNYPDAANIQITAPGKEITEIA